MPNRQVSASVRAKKGDTVWGITSRELEAKLGRKPTNAEINKTMRNAGTKVPSGDINKIKPGDLVQINLRGIGAAPTKKPATRGQTADAARYAGQAKKASTTRGQSADAARYAGQARKQTTPPRKRTLPATPESGRKRTLPATPESGRKRTLSATTGKAKASRRSDGSRSQGRGLTAKKKTTTKRTAPTRSTGRTGRGMNQY
jgi:hypothetical protein